ncbi:MAG: hypothetical protein L0Y79_01435 [Chlorobi bacterium]|nr:hypothetical protein [Chlorobiota bacterium]MCI0716455.1 hypothetical protein [Chlorobiota bacterium]
MKQTLSFFLLLALHSFVFEINTYSEQKQIEPRKLKYEYTVETDLSVKDFSDVFCERLSSKHKWSKVSAIIELDDTYTSVFRFNDEANSSWKCELKIKKIVSEINKMSVEMVIAPFFGS